MPTRLARIVDRPIVRYVWAIAIVVASFLLRLAIQNIFDVELAPFVTFYPAVMLAALLAGFWPGLLATLLAAALAAYWIFPPIRSFAIADKSSYVSCAFFVGMGLFMSLVAERYRRGEKQLAIHKEQQARRESDDKLRQTEEQFEALANSIPQLCWMANPDGWIFWYNQRWYEYTGTTPEEMQGWAWQSVHNPDTLPKVLEQWKTSIATATPFEMVLPLKGKNGEFRSFLTRVVPVMDAVGKVVRWFGTNTDIDEQMRIEVALRNSNSRLDLALEVAGMGEWELDLRNHTASRSLRHGQIFGYEAPLPAWTYEMFLDHVTPEHRTDVQEKFNSSRVLGTWDFETQIRRRDGEIRWIWARGRAVLDDAGEPIRMYGIVMDIHERKQAEEAQAADRAKLAAALASMTDAVLISDISGQFIQFNDAFAAFCRFSDKAECSTKLSDLRKILEIRTLGGELVPLDSRPIPRSLRGEADTNVEYDLTRTDTGETWVGSYSFNPIRDGVGEIIGSVMVVRDITERKRIEDELRRSKALHNQLLDTMDEGFCLIQMMFDPESKPVDWRFLEVNPAFEKQSGWRDVVGKRLREVSPNHNQSWLDFQGNVALTGEPGYIYESQSLNGFYEVHAYRIGEPEQRQVAVLFNDVTARKLAEEERKGLLETIEKERDTLSALFGAMNDEVWFFDTSMTSTFLNAAAIKSLERSGCTAAENVVMDEAATMVEMRRADGSLRSLDESPPARALKGEVVRNEEEIVTFLSTGEKRYRELNASPILDAAGVIIGSLVVVHDINERKRGEENIRRLNRIYAVLSDINHTIMREKDSQALLDAACRIAVDRGKFQMAWIGIVDQASKQFRPVAACGDVDGYLEDVSIDLGDERYSYKPAVRCVLSAQHSVCNDIEGDTAYLPWRDKALRSGYRSSVALPLIVDGRVIGALTLYASEPGFFDDEELVLLDEIAMNIGFAVEVNRHEEDRRRAEEELRWRTAFFEAMVESSPNGIMVVDRRGKIILQNQRVFDLWKIPSEITQTNDDAKQVGFDTSATTAGAETSAIARGLTVGTLRYTSAEWSNRLKDPDQFVERIEYLYSHPDEIGQDEVSLLDGTILDRDSSPVKDKAGTYYGRIWVFHDITKQRRLEEQFRQSQKMEAVGQLTGGIAHDFNNLLGVIVGNLDLIESRVSEDAVVVRRVQTAQKAAQRGADLTRRLLAFSSNVELKPEPTDLHLCVLNMIELSRAIGSDLRFTTNFDELIPPVLVDAAGLENALLNLVVNARDAMPNGGAIIIATQITRLEENYPPVQSGDMKAGRYAGVSVSDTGCGMSKKTLDRVFEPFFTTKPQGKGTGLGLAMVYGFVKQSGGSVRIYSEPGVGTSVTFYVPLAEDAVPSASITVRTPSPGRRGGKVLIVDDELDLVDIATAYLDWLGYMAYQAEDGASALAIVEQNRDIDLVITDIIMPGGMNGVELVQKIRQLLPEVKVIYSSGFPANTLAERSMQLLDGPLLRKPYQRADFEAAIHLALE